MNAYAHWHLNENSGSVAYDSSNNSRHGTCIGSPVWSGGKLNNCLQLNGTSQYVDCGSCADFEHTQPFSIEAWIRLSVSGTYMILAKEQKVAPYRGWAFYCVSNYLYFTLVSNSSNSSLWVRTGASLYNDLYHHVVITYNGNGLCSGVKLYIDGANYPCEVMQDNLNATIKTTVNCQIGARDGGSLLKGYVDEALIYDIELSADQVLQRWNNGSGTELLEETPPEPPEVPDDEARSGIHVNASTLDSLFSQVITLIENTEKLTCFHVFPPVYNPSDAKWHCIVILERSGL